MGSCTSSLRGSRTRRSILYEAGESSRWRNVRSIDGGDAKLMTATFVNETQETLVLCWVDKGGALFHHIPIHSPGDIQDGSVDNANRHFTQSGHCFVLYRKIEITPETLSDVPTSAFRALYRGYAEVANESHVIRIRANQIDFTVSPPNTEKSLIDNSNKIFKESLESGFRCYFDDGVEVADMDVIRKDLIEVERLLPTNALDLLQRHTCFYVNSSLIYGYREDPIDGLHASYHPRGSARWLQEHGLSESHEGSIEIMNVKNYCQERVCWGAGGLLLHELSHSYHDKHMDNGYDNKSLRVMYDEAMNKALYDQVRYRRRDGTYSELQRGYCCTDPMEFFAETSVAFFHRGQGEGDFNKWFPHSCRQLREHDEATFKALTVAWNDP